MSSCVLFDDFEGTQKWKFKGISTWSRLYEEYKKCDFVILTEV